jgi:hypothetical protein
MAMFAAAAVALVEISGCAAMSLVPTVTQRARTLLEIVFEELPFPTGDAKHLAQTSSKATVDGVEYDTKYATSVTLWGMFD